MAFELPRLPLVGLEPEVFQIYWQKTVEAIEGQINDMIDVQAQLADQLAQIQIVLRNDSISTSWTSPGEILTGSDAGTDATITVAAHTRKYTDGTEVAVNGGSLPGLAYSTVYFVYYDDPDRAGGAVTYQVTTDANVGLSGAVGGRHGCGSIQTPAAGAADTNGGVSAPTGGGDIHTRYDVIT